MLEKITVMNRNEAIKHTYKRHIDGKAAMLSICSSDICYTSSPKSCRHVPLIKKVVFDDIMPGEHGLLMTEGQADDVMAFVKRIAELGFTHLIVHCDEGISRSAAAAQAIAESPGFTEAAVCYNRTPNPNSHVYELMKQAYETSFFGTRRV